MGYFPIRTFFFHSQKSLCPFIYETVVCPEPTVSESIGAGCPGSAVRRRTENGFRFAVPGSKAPPHRISSARNALDLTFSAIGVIYAGKFAKTP